MSGFAEGTPTVEIQLGGKSYTLGFTLGSMRRAKELNVLTLDASDETALMLGMPAYVWACLSEETRRELSVEAIGELMNPSNMKAIALKVGELFKASVPKEDSDPNAEPAAVKEPTAGKSTLISSGQLASTT